MWRKKSFFNFSNTLSSRLSILSLLKLESYCTIGTFRELGEKLLELQILTLALYKWKRETTSIAMLVQKWGMTVTRIMKFNI
jgi:hypothetical protein